MSLCCTEKVYVIHKEALSDLIVVWARLTLSYIQEKATERAMFCFLMNAVLPGKRSLVGETET